MPPGRPRRKVFGRPPAAVPPGRPSLGRRPAPFWFRPAAARVGPTRHSPVSGRPGLFQCDPASTASDGSAAGFAVCSSLRTAASRALTGSRLPMLRPPPVARPSATSLLRPSITRAALGQTLIARADLGRLSVARRRSGRPSVARTRSGRPSVARACSCRWLVARLVLGRVLAAWTIFALASARRRRRRVEGRSVHRRPVPHRGRRQPQVQHLIHKAYRHRILRVVGQRPVNRDPSQRPRPLSPRREAQQTRRRRHISRLHSAQHISPERDRLPLPVGASRVITHLQIHQREFVGQATSSSVRRLSDISALGVPHRPAAGPPQHPR